MRNAIISRMPSNAAAIAGELHPGNSAAQIAFLRERTEIVFTGILENANSRWRDIPGERVSNGFQRDSIRSKDGFTYFFRFA